MSSSNDGSWPPGNSSNNGARTLRQWVLGHNGPLVPLAPRTGYPSFGAPRQILRSTGYEGTAPGTPRPPTVPNTSVVSPPLGQPPSTLTRHGTSAPMGSLPASAADTTSPQAPSDPPPFLYPPFPPPIPVQTQYSAQLLPVPQRTATSPVIEEDATLPPLQIPGSERSGNSPAPSIPRRVPPHGGSQHSNSSYMSYRAPNDPGNDGSDA